MVQYQAAALRLATIYQELDDKYKCQDVIDKFIGHAKLQGTRSQYKQALEAVLPTSPVYEYLEGRLSHPALTYQSIAQITEFEEKERINKEIGERRTRLGAKIGQVTIEVKREVLQGSDLEDLYAKIIDWSIDDDVRRQYEEKLIQRCFETLTVLPPGRARDEKRVKLLKLADDMVIIKHPYKLAWDISIEWKDPVGIHDLDANILREYDTFFPTSGLAQVLRGFMTSEISRFPRPPPAVKPEQTDIISDSEEDDDGGGVALDGPSDEDRLFTMVEGMSDAPKSILAHRLMGLYYQFLDEYESTVELMRNGKRLLVEESAKTGLSFLNSSDEFTTLLGTALVFYQSPRNHPEAKLLFESLLKRKPTSTPAMIGIGLIYEEEEDYAAAVDFLDRALTKDSHNIRIKAEAAWVRALSGNYLDGKDGLEACLPSLDGKESRTRDLLAQTQYRIGVCLWNLDTSRTARKDRNGAYSYFLACLKSNLNYAPAYTSLGIFYAEYSKDKKRARKCFQKAFELSASEVVAAERLAKIFASSGEWDLVEVVAQRVVNSGKVKPAPGSKKKGISWPFAALGTAELNKQDYSKSIVSFQAALRITPNDYHSWVGLGESYHNSGRYIAATKAFQHAETFEREVADQNSGETWFAKHMLASVKRELGDFDVAIDGYSNILRARPDEFGVAIALLQTLVDSAWDGVDKGLFGHAATRASEAIQTALGIASSRPDAFNLWRAVGDACSVFSWVQGKMSDFPCLKLKSLLGVGSETEVYKLFADIDGVAISEFSEDASSEDQSERMELTRCIHGAILSHKRAIHVSAHDIHAQAVAYYNLGWTEHRAHVCLSSGLKKRPTRYLKAAVRCFKRAIELEAGNAEFWNALGVVTSEMNPKVAQHSFVRSLFLNERSAQAWVNLGTVYLLENDIQLANDAFTRAQSTDPDFAQAWVGQGLIALMTGNVKEADLLFTHAMEISNAAPLITKRRYAISAFDRIIASKVNLSVAEIVAPLFALNQIQSMAPNNLPYQHLATLLLERIDNIPLAVETLSSICTTVETDYEITESPSSLSRFALAKADLARSQLASGMLSEAVDSGDTALQLSAEDAGNELTPEARQKCRLSAHLTVGLAHFHLENPTAALEYFQPALEESDSNPDAVCLLAQVLWAEDNPASRSKARDYLFDCISMHPEHVQSIVLLGTMALLDNDTESLEAVISTLQDLRAMHTLTDQEQERVSELLRAIAALSAEDATQAVLFEVQTDLLLHPSQPHSWARLADVGDSAYASELGLKTAVKAVPPHGELEAVDISKAFGGSGQVADAQKSVFLAPWARWGWEALADSTTV